MTHKTHKTTPGADAERAAFESWAIPILGDNPNWRGSGDGELARQAWQAAIASRAPAEPAADDGAVEGEATPLGHEAQALGKITDAVADRSGIERALVQALRLLMSDIEQGADPSDKECQRISGSWSKAKAAIDAAISGEQAC